MCVVQDDKDGAREMPIECKTEEHSKSNSMA